MGFLIQFAGFLAWVIIGCSRLHADSPDRPNVVLILCDNLGYGDLGCYGSKLHRTPNVDHLAAQGVRMTHCYAASGVCTPSRAALMTGCYPLRVGMHVSETGGAVLQPISVKGLHPDEVTLAEVLKAQGYATACIGKWHLGDQPELLPTRQGFDEFFGIPYSDDMVERTGKPWPPLPLMRGEKVVEAPADRDTLTRRYTQESIKFIQQRAERPFFVYLAHAMPGSTDRPFASEGFKGKSANSPWGDSVEEIDWSLGQILDELTRLKLDEKTLVIFTSDNGAPRRSPPQGSNAPLKGWGYSTDEGAMRVPLLARWPGRIRGGRTCEELVTLLDLLPTLAHVSGGAVPKDRTIDGRSIWPLLAGEQASASPHEFFFYYQGDQLQAVRDARWKLYLPLKAKRGLGQSGKPAELALYDLRADAGEARNVAVDHPDAVRKLEAAAERARADLGDAGRPGPNTRPAGRVKSATPRVR